MSTEEEPEVMTYRAFKNKETLLAWQQRWRQHQDGPQLEPRPRVPGVRGFGRLVRAAPSPLRSE